MVFFDPHNLNRERDQQVQELLKGRLPDIPWEATNQAAVHRWYEQEFGYTVEPLSSIEDAIGTWPETATSSGVRVQRDGRLMVVAPFGLADLFHLRLRRNLKRVSLEQYRRRIAKTKIGEKWPLVTIIDE